MEAADVIDARICSEIRKIFSIIPGTSDERLALAVIPLTRSGINPSVKFLADGAFIRSRVISPYPSIPVILP